MHFVLHMGEKKGLSCGFEEEGQMVRITDGKFKGVVGTVARYKSQQRVGIVIDGLLTVCTAYVPSAFIESVI